MAHDGFALTERVEQLVGARRFREAHDALEAAPNDGNALYVLATWRLSGTIVRRDLAEARRLFGEAGRRGRADARRIHLNLIANGTGGAANWPETKALLEQAAPADSWAAAQVELIGQMALTDDGESIALPEPEAISDRPSISVLRGLFSPQECVFLIEAARPHLQSAVVIDPVSGRPMRHPVRTSDGMAFPFVLECPAVHLLNRRLAAATGTGVRQGEPLQLLRYRRGQEYRPHVDAIAGDSNPRVTTALVWLNDGYSGGETCFDRLGWSFKGEPGDALVFSNILPDGRPDEATRHAGLPVVDGEKFLASRWIRSRAFAVAPPQPILRF